MISYYTYKLIHLAALVLLLLSLGSGLCVSKDKRFSMLHGISLLFLLVAGFGLLARLAISWPWQGWIIVKLLAWFGLGVLPFFSRRYPQTGRLFWWISAFLAILATAMAIYKPF